MKNENFELELQAYFDNELSPKERARVETMLAKEQGSAPLLVELKNTREALRGFEAECKLPESREFFWSKIEKQIERESRAGRAGVSISWLASVRRYLMPAAGVALVCGLLGMLAVHLNHKSNQGGEMELASQDMGAYTFRDQQQQMTMVWLYNRDDSQFTDATATDTVERE